MKEFSFQYTNQRYIFLLIIGCILSSLITVVVGMYFSNGNNSYELLILFIAAILPFIVFRIFKKGIKIQGQAFIHDTFVEFNLDGISTKISFKNLVSYKIDPTSHGIILTLKTIDSKKLRITAHSYYCDTKPFDIFCSNIESTLKNLKETGSINIVKEGSIYATKGFFLFLILTTPLITLAFLIEDKSVRISIISFCLFFMILQWIQYFSARNRNANIIS